MRTDTQRHREYHIVDITTALRQVHDPPDTQDFSIRFEED